MMTSRVTLTVMGCLLLMRCTVHALQAYQSSIPNGANVVRNGASWPGVGHVTAAGGTANNQFGLDFASAGHSWTASLCNKDSDGDGYSNGMELGDPNCVWSSGATPSRTTGISHPGFSDSTPTVATTTTTTTTAAPPTTTTTAAPPTTTTTAAPPTTTTTAAPPTTTTTAAPPTTTTTAAPTTTTTTAAPTVAPTTTAAPPGVTTTTTAAPPTTTTTPSPPTPTTASPPTTTTTSAPPGATTPQPTPAPVTSKVTTTPAPLGVTTKAPVTLFAGPSGSSGLTTSTLTSTPRITARVGPTPSSAIGSTGASSVTTDGAEQATTTDGLTAPPGSPVATAANASLGDGATTAPISSSAEVVAAITAPVTVLGGAMRFNWTIFRPVVNRQRRSAAPSDVVDMAIHSASATEYVGFGVSASSMTGALVACYVGSTVAGNTIVRCLSGTGDGLSATFSTPSTTTVQVLSWSVSANGGFDVTVRCSASALGLVAGSRQRLIVSRGTVMATQDLVLGHGTSSTDRDELVIDAYAGTSTTADDSTNQWIATYITIAVCLVTLVVAGAMNAARIVLGPSASSAARLSVMFLFLGLLGLYIGMSHRDHDRNLKSTPVGRAFGDGAVFCLWFVLYPVPKHVSVGTVAGSSFERLITYHSTIGMMLFVVSTVHVATMLSLESDIATRVFTWQGDQPILAGLVAWICIVLMVLTAFLRRWLYSLFRLVHLLALPTIIFACLHYPPLVLALIPPLLNVAVDLCLRLRSHCVSAPVVTRVLARPSHVMLVLQVPGVKSVPAGSFVNLGVSASGCIGYPHPVSVAWFDETTHEATFLIRPMSSTGSWSATLHERACVSASDVLGSRVSWQGPYGALQVPLGSTPGVLLVAGGIGVTPMLSILQKILTTPHQQVQRVVLMWSLKACEYELRADVEDLLAQCGKTSTVDLGIVFFLTGGAAVSTDRSGDGSVVALRRRMEAAVDIPTVVQLLRNSLPLAAVMPQIDGVPSKSPRAKHYANVDAAVVDVEPSITDLPLGMYCCGPASLMSACYREAAATRGMKYHEETFDL